MIAYLTTQGARLVREGQHLLLRKGGDIYHTLFIHKLEQVVVVGNVEITAPALKLLLAHNIDTFWMRRDGRYLGRLVGAEPKNAFLRRKQFLLTQDEEFCLRVARAIVVGKMANMATLLARIKRTRGDEKAAKAAKEVRGFIRKAHEAKILDELRGYEGAASLAYFAGLRRGFKHDWGFTRRVRRPPTDPVNSLLSLLYTFLMNRVYAAVRLAGLDPQPGTLHALEYSRYCLPLDLMEELRTIVVDTLVLGLLNLEVLKPDDFEQLKPPKPDAAPAPGLEALIEAAAREGVGEADEAGVLAETSDLPGPQTPPDAPEELPRDGKTAVVLTHQGMQKVIRAFEKKLATVFFHPVAQKKMSYAEAMVFQARAYRQVVEGQVPSYQPLLMK